MELQKIQMTEESLKALEDKLYKEDEFLKALADLRGIDCYCELED